MKKLLGLALCLCAMFTLGLSLVGVQTHSEPEAVKVSSKKDITDVTEGSEDEGIYLLSAVVGK